MTATIRPSRTTSAEVAIPSSLGIKHTPRARTRTRVKYVTRGPTRA